MTTRNKLAAGLAVAFALVLMLLGFGGVAGADTSECASSVQTHNGITANYCASQDIAAAGVELAVPNKARAYSRVTFKVTSTTNRQEDFEWFNPSGPHADNQKLAEWAPGGNPSGLYLSVSNSGTVLVLKHLQAGGNAAGQQWVANGPDPAGGFQWASEANGRAISDPTGAPYARAVLVLTGGSSFTYVQ